jgi:hypothetical protein
LGGGGRPLPFFPETFIFIGIVLLNRDLNLGGNWDKVIEEIKSKDKNIAAYT